MAPNPVTPVIRLNDVAKKAGVSRSLAGRVLLGSGENIRMSPQTAERVRRAATALNYQPNQSARQLRGARTHLLGALVLSSHRSTTLNRLAALEQEAFRRGYHMLIGHIMPNGENLDWYLNDFRQRGVEAVLPLDLHDSSVTEKLLALPRTIFSLEQPTPTSCCVIPDHAKASRIAVDYLVAHHRKRIGLIVRYDNSSYLQRKCSGYLEAIADHGLDTGKDLLQEIEGSGDQYYANIAQSVERLVHKRVDAILTGNDLIAYWVQTCLRRLGVRVPEDVALIGSSNDHAGSVMDPSLTTFDYRHDEFARAMMNMVNEWITTGKVDPSRRTVFIDPAFVLRGSTP